MSEHDHGPWVVLKFGGTSVSTRSRWETIGRVIRARLDGGMRPLVVCSAVSGVSNLLEQMVREAPSGRFEPILDKLWGLHRALGESMGLDALALLREDMEELRRASLGASLVREVSPRLHARILARGELMSTRLGVAFLQALGMSVSWIDARVYLQSVPERDANESRQILSATCAFDPDPELASRLAALPRQAIVTQGFIARDAEGSTVLLGRGGSDTSASYFAAKLGAVRCEIWTDVPGMYTANPHQIPSARLLRSLDYSEAQEVVSTGAKVLHPRCIAPVRHANIPLHVKCTDLPDLEGTVVAAQSRGAGAQVKAISVKTGVTLVSMDTPGMWQQVGFLADIFEVFKRVGVSIDLVSTSEMNVTVTLDAASNRLDTATLDRLVRELAPHCRAQIIGPCASVSLVGRSIRAILHKLGPAFEVFQEQRVHLVSQAASDLNLSFVVDTDQADRLVVELHDLLFAGRKNDPVLGPSWQETFSDTPREEVLGAEVPWWSKRRDELLELAAHRTPLYVYDEPTLQASVEELRGIGSVDRILYAMKANSHPHILGLFEAAGLGFECVSPGEIAHLFRLFASLDPKRILFTPNFAPRREYEEAFERGVRVTLDNLYPVIAWPEVFRGRELFVRVDPGEGRGHHEHVRTAGATSKFGVSPDQLEELSERLRALDVRVIGLHAHLGSGIHTAQDWVESGIFLAAVAERFPEVRVLDLGGGLGVPERPGQAALDLHALDEMLAQVKHAHPAFELWLEPGRYLVARAGVLLASVTQTKQKEDVSYIGIDAGMNTLIRPALYGAYHQIVNLSRLGESPSTIANVVGPICETGDTLGHSRSLPAPGEGDIVLVATVGAYGRSMSSNYNLREPAEEVILSG